jgi:hypothetical protein
MVLNPMKKIDIKVDNKGNATIMNIYSYGTQCGSVAEQIEKLLGTPDENTRGNTEEYYKQDNTLTVNQ